MFETDDKWTKTFDIFYVKQSLLYQLVFEMSLSLAKSARGQKQWSTKHYTEGETIQWPRGQTMIYKTLHRRRDNTMAKRTNNDLQNTT